MSTSIPPFAVQPGGGAPLETPTGARVRIKADTRSTNGSFTVIELGHQPKKGPPLHTHSNEDEVWYVLEGDYRFKAGDSMFRLSEGGMAFGPRGTPHCFQNVGDELGRLLVITTPAGVERYFEEFAELPPGPVDPQVHAALARATGIELVGPPLEVSDPSTLEDRSRVGDFEDFRRDFLPRFIEAQRAFHDGDAEPNIALWTTTDPVTLLAARGLCDSGTEHVTKTFRWVASEFSDVRDYEWELLASGVSGDLAYTVAIERCWMSIRGGPQALTELRATHVFHREAGQWQAVHRHADHKGATDDATPTSDA